MLAVLPQARALQACAAAVLLLTFAYFFLGQSWPTDTHPRWPHASGSLTASKNITLDLEIITDLGLERPAKFDFRRYCMQAREKRSLHRQSVVAFPDELSADSVEITVERNFVPSQNEKTLFPSCESSAVIDVPEFSSHSHTSTAPLMLGVATTLARISDSLPTFARWLSKTGSPLVALLVDQQDLETHRKEIDRVHQMAVRLEIELILEPYHPITENDSEGLKNFGLATVLDQNRRPETKWFGIIDDDTFFLSLHRMLDALEPYDPKDQWYIGALTEGHTRVAQEGFKAWGGAGFFVSPPLMRILAENAEECTPLDKFFGDILWRDCIMEVTSPTVQLTELRGLNQMDIWKDVSGWYEAGLNPILTVHHWKSWHFFPVKLSHLVTDVAGPDAMLQRYQFGNNTVFTNGYSLVEYPKGVPDLNLVELTMTEDVNIDRPPERLEFHHSMGRTRPALRRGKEKISWTFEHAVITTDGTVRQFYVNRPAPESEANVSIIEIDWRHG